MSLSLSHHSRWVSLLTAAVSSLAAASLSAQQGVDPDASSGGILAVPYIVPRSSTVEPVSQSDKKRLNRRYVSRKAAERDTVMGLAQTILPISASQMGAPTGQLATPVPRATPSTTPPHLADPRLGKALPPGSAFLDPARVAQNTTPATSAVDSHPSPVASRDAMLRLDSPQDGGEVPDTTATALDSTGEYFIIRPALQGTHLRRTTVDRILNLAREYTRRSLKVTYIVAIEMTPDDDDETDALISEADVLRKQLLGIGVSEDQVIVRDAAPTGPHSSLRILLRGPRLTSVQPMTTPGQNAQVSP